MILNQAQAEAVYSAMCALNNVSANKGIEVSFAGTFCGDYSRLSVIESAGGDVTVTSTSRRLVEHHKNQAAFATTYGLQQG